MPKRKRETELTDVFATWDLFRELACFLPAAELFCLLDTCRTFRVFAERVRRSKLLTQRVMNALKNWNVPTPSKDLVLSGSLLLAALNGDSWTPHDADFYTMNPEARLPQVITVWSRGRHYMAFCADLYKSESIVEVVMAKAQNDLRHIQLIRLNIPPVDHVVNEYDLDFLKNTFDGQQVIIHRKQQFQVRASKPHNASQIKHPMHRFAKYVGRGYTVSGFRIEPFTYRGFKLRKLTMSDRPYVPPEIRDPLGDQFEIADDDYVKLFGRAYVSTESSEYLPVRWINNICNLTELQCILDHYSSAQQSDAWE